MVTAVAECSMEWYIISIWVLPILDYELLCITLEMLILDREVEYDPVRANANQRANPHSSFRVLPLKKINEFAIDSSIHWKAMRIRKNWPFWNPRGKKGSCHSLNFCRGRENLCFPHSISFCLHASVTSCIYRLVAEISSLCFHIIS